MQKKYSLIDMLFISFIWCFIGMTIVINFQKPSGTVHNPMGYNIYTITFLGQDFNYIQGETLSSIND